MELITTKALNNFFHLNNHEVDKTLNIKINNLKIPYDKTLKYLWVYLNRTLSYWKHLEKTADKLKKRKSQIQKVNQNILGCLTICIENFCYSIAECCAPVRSHSSHTAKIDIQLC